MSDIDALIKSKINKISNHPKSQSSGYHYFFVEISVINYCSHQSGFCCVLFTSDVGSQSWDWYLTLKNVWCTKLIINKNYIFYDLIRLIFGLFRLTESLFKRDNRKVEISVAQLMCFILLSSHHLSVLKHAEFGNSDLWKDFSYARYANDEYKMIETV